MITQGLGSYRGFYSPEGALHQYPWVITHGREPPGFGSPGRAEYYSNLASHFGLKAENQNVSAFHDLKAVAIDNPAPSRFQIPPAPQMFGPRTQGSLRSAADQSKGFRDFICVHPGF